MTCKSFWEYIFKKKKVYEAAYKESDGKYPHHLSDLGPGAAVGIDISIILHRALKIIDAAREFSVDPPIPITHAVQRIGAFAKSFVLHGVTPVFVFDGSKVPLKLSTDVTRTKKREKAISVLASLEPRIQNAHLADEAFKGMAYPREDFVTDVILSLKELGFLVFGAAYEAEYQLVRMERDGIIDAIFTTDGDGVLAGAQQVIAEYDEKSGHCTLIARSTLLECGNWGRLGSAGLMDDTGGFGALSSALGNDYICRLKMKSKGKKRSIRTMYANEVLGEVRQLLDNGRINKDAVLTFGNDHYRRKCQLRYTSETVFSRATDCKALQDRISYGFHSHINDIHSLALGLANLCQPFYLPTDGYFVDLMAARSRGAAKKKADRVRRRVAELARRREEVAAAAEEKEGGEEGSLEDEG